MTNPDSMMENIQLMLLLQKIEFNVNKNIINT